VPDGCGQVVEDVGGRRVHRWHISQPQYDNPRVADGSEFLEEPLGHGEEEGAVDPVDEDVVVCGPAQLAAPVVVRQALAGEGGATGQMEKGERPGHGKSNLDGHNEVDGHGGHCSEHQNGCN
jgi:hypothetical protein